MNLKDDIKSPTLLKVKGLLFALIAVLAGSILLLDNFSLRSLALLLLTIWASCRFYYFLFYVLEHYAGGAKPYAGIWDAFVSLFKK